MKKEQNLAEENAQTRIASGESVPKKKEQVSARKTKADGKKTSTVAKQKTSRTEGANDIKNTTTKAKKSAETPMSQAVGKNTSKTAKKIATQTSKKSLETGKKSASKSAITVENATVVQLDKETASKLPTTKRSSKPKKHADQTKASVQQSVRVVDGGREVASLKQYQIDSYDELESYKRLLTRRRKRLWTRLGAFFLLIIIVPFMVFVTTLVIDHNGEHNFFGFKFYVVTTDSMEPEIMPNDCVVLVGVTSIDDLNVGDDIGYINARDQVVIHRIIAFEEQNGERVIVTKGIHNPSADQLRVTFDQVVGKRVSTQRALGNAIVFFRSTGGIITLCAIFAVTICAFYVAFRLSEDIHAVDRV